MVFLACVLCFLRWVSTPSTKSPFYCMNILLLRVFLFLAFSSSNLIVFYVFFEACLIPTLVLIIGWGYQPERLLAGSYIMIYTVGASLPLLLVLVWWCLENGTMRVRILSYKFRSLHTLLLFVIYGAFLVKLPIYGVHLWLPKAHVEAPLAGSIILAGILLKLGGYGILLANLRFNLTISAVSFFLVRFRMWGGLIAMLMCLRQTDIKAFVAYRSVGHMGIVSSGLILDQS